MFLVVMLRIVYEGGGVKEEEEEGLSRSLLYWFKWKIAVFG